MNNAKRLDRIESAIRELSAAVARLDDGDLIPTPRHAADAIDTAEVELSGDEAQAALAKQFEATIRRRRLELLGR
jgi:hypothetical protein